MTVTLQIMDGLGAWHDVTIEGDDLEVIDAGEGELHVRDHALGTGLASLVLGAGFWQWRNQDGSSTLPVVA
jgi:hypothetical protein